MRLTVYLNRGGGSQGHPMAGPGWRLTFSPGLWRKERPSVLGELLCPRGSFLAMIRTEESGGAVMVAVPGSMTAPGGPPAYTILKAAAALRAAQSGRLGMSFEPALPAEGG